MLPHNCVLSDPDYIAAVDCARSRIFLDLTMLIAVAVCMYAYPIVWHEACSVIADLSLFKTSPNVAWWLKLYCRDFRPLVTSIRRRIQTGTMGFSDAFGMTLHPDITWRAPDIRFVFGPFRCWFATFQC